LTSLVFAGIPNKIMSFRLLIVSDLLDRIQIDAICWQCRTSVL